MSPWDPARYLTFETERSRPFADLLARVDLEPRTIIDLGCGPGHLTALLRSRWPHARVHGVDSSPEMIDAARAGTDDPLVGYELADVSTWEPPEPVDLMVSNALFQWVPDQRRVIERLSASVAPGGAFALQVPDNYREPSHALLDEIASREPFADLTVGLHEDRGTRPEAYLDLFGRIGWTVDAWATSYLHVLQGDDPVFAWISGTGARPVLDALPTGLREEFVELYSAALRAAYPPRPWGTVMSFTRTFAVARRPA